MVDADLVVIGAGIAGSSLTRKARGRGIETVLVDANPAAAASRLALAALRRSWAGTSQRDRFDRSLAWYKAEGWVNNDGTALVTNTKGTTSIQRDWWLVDPLAPLLEPDLAQRVVALHETAVSFVDRPSLRGRAVVVATGASRGALTAADVPLWGRVAISADTRETTNLPPLAVRILGPYRSLIAATAGDTVRLGASRARTREASAAQMEKLLVEAESTGLIGDASRYICYEGCRAIHPGRAGDPRRISESVWRMSGFGRTGYSLAPAVADELLDEITGELIW